MGQPVVHFEIMGQDADVLFPFYAELFGWQIAEIEGPVRYGLVDREANADADGVGIGGGIGTGAPSSYVTFYVEVPDVEAALASAERLGGTRLMGPERMGPVEVGLFNDPEGHMVGVVKSA